MKVWFLAFSLLAGLAVVYPRSLEAVSDDDLVNLIKTEDNVVVLFTKNNCNGCEELETVVENLQDDLEDSLKAVVVKSHNSPMVSIYDPTKEPSLIYFRRGIPLLYHGKANEDEILHVFTENQEPAVKELSDANFEHLTQAATGATTGDWFVFFYSNDCVMCQRLYAIWESVGATLKRRMNVARVNRLEAGISTAKRFNIKKSPEFVILRQGKFHRYRSTDYTPSAFVQFAEGGYSRDKGEAVPPVGSNINEYLRIPLDFVLSRPYLLMYLVVGLGLTLLTALLAKRIASKKSKTAQKSKKAK